MEKSTQIIKKEIVTYTFTEDELNELKAKERAYGSRKTMKYIMFCLKNYKLKLNLAGYMQFICDLCAFISEETDTISNQRGWSLFDWLHKGSDWICVSKKE